MVLVGAIRPGFNAFVTRVFGAEVNGQAATVISLIFLASLPATAALPVVMVRDVSRALGAEEPLRARAFARFAVLWGLVLCALGLAIAALSTGDTLTTPELVFLILGTSGYAYWRIFRMLLLSVGRAAYSLKAELFAVLLLAVGLGALALLERPQLAVGPFAVCYLGFAFVALPAALPHLRGGALSAADRADFARYNVLWFIGAASSLATRELAVLLLDRRVDESLVGEMSVALSLLMMLALAPRIIELPLVHEFSELSGKKDRARQIALTERALHWLTIFTYGVACSVALLAAPILELVANIQNQLIARAFGVVAFAFMTEMIVTPATNLLTAEAPPWVLTLIGAASLVLAVALWAVLPGGALMVVVAGLALSYGVKAIGIALYARLRFGVRLFAKPLQKAIALLVGTGLVALTHTAQINPWLAFALFGVTMVGLFFKDILEVIQAFHGRAHNESP